MASIEDILLSRAAEEAAEVQNLSNIASVGGGIAGAGAGLMLGQGAHVAGNMINPKAVQGALGPVRPGGRFAGTLIGALVGGKLGEWATKEAYQHPAATLLAKIQTSGQLTPSDQIALQSILQDTYTGIM